jgi:hypothetical protein
MKASKVITTLQRLIKEYGDLHVYLTSDHFSGENVGVCHLVRNVEICHEFGKSNSDFFCIDNINYNPDIIEEYGD